jgi:ParB family transcriptional regulator, chromosome partitioning protein
MKPQRIERIPINQIRVVNPRTRNKKTFRGIINNIGEVGLKKPITVFRRELAQDGTRYDLVCGQGRLESVAALGGKDIPAIITDASLKERYLMSLVENIARKRPNLSDLLAEIRRLKKSGHQNVVIAAMLGLGHTYVEGIIRLLKCGEDRLVERVEAGTIPLSVAVKIATADDAQIQRVLGDAYDKGELRGAKLYAVQRLIAQRHAQQRSDPATPAPTVSTKDLVKEYERHTHRQRELVARAVVVRERLALLTAAMRQLVADKDFVQLLATEGLETMPEQLAMRLR